MKIKIILLMLLAASFIMFGCAGKAKTQQQPPDTAAPADQNPPAAEQPDADTGGQPEEPGEDASELADLFQVDTDKPISDEGLDVSTPSSSD